MLRCIYHSLASVIKSGPQVHQNLFYCFCNPQTLLVSCKGLSQVFWCWLQLCASITVYPQHRRRGSLWFCQSGRRWGWRKQTVASWFSHSATDAPHSRRWQCITLVSVSSQHYACFGFPWKKLIGNKKYFTSCDWLIMSISQFLHDVRVHTIIDVKSDL